MNNKKHTSTTIRLLLLIGCLFVGLASSEGQSKRIDWNNTNGGSANDQIHDVIEATNGYLIAVGETNSNTRGGKDGIILITDFYTGAVITQKTIGGKQEDVLRSVVQHWDGTFLLAGHTSSKGKGKKDAWLINMDTYGNILWEETYGTTQSDEFSSIAIAPNGQIFAAGKLGSKGGKAWLVVLEKDKVVIESHLGNGTIESVKDLIVTNTEEVVLTGITKKAKGQRAGDAFLLKTDLVGQKKWLKYYGENDWEEALALTATNDGGYAFAGLTKSKGEGDMDMWLVKTDASGVLQWDATYGGSDADIANGLVQTYDNGFALLGITQSHTPGARRYNMSLVKTNSRGRKVWEENFGGNREDVGNCLVQVHDGSLFMGGGTSSKGNGEKDAWLLKTTANKEDVFALAAIKNPQQALGLSTVAFAGENETNLKANERAYLFFDVTNRSMEPLLNVYAEVKPVFQVEGIKVLDRLVIGAVMPGETKQISVPIKTDDRLQEGLNQFQINLLVGNQTLQSTQANVSSSKVLPAALAFGSSNFRPVTGTRGNNPSYRAILEVNIQNLGQQSAQNIRGKFIPPDGIKTITDPEFTIDFLRPNSTHVAVFDFLVNTTTNYPDEKIPVKCVLKTGDGKEDISGTFTLTLNEPTKAAGTARSSSDLIWISPNPDESGARIVSDKEFLDIKIKAVSDNELQAEDFTIYLNNSSQDGSKADQRQLSQPQRKGGSFRQTYENRVALKLGLNKIEVEVQDAGGNFKTIPIEVTYAPERANLHVLAIGPTHKDLEYTGADAQGFAEAFRNQGNRIFDKVFIRSLSTKATTSKDEIKKALVDLQFNYESNNEEAITDKDVLIIFISSHAKRNGRNFVILPSDYDPKYEAIYTLDYERDIVQYLKNINCKKLMFLDACNSGSAFAAVSGIKSADNDGLAEAINKINSTMPGMSTVTSCQKREKSYEDKAWQNGAFTEGILEAFSNKSFADVDGRNYWADKDNDGTLTLGELSSYLTKRVPNLVKSAKPDAPTTQIPNITDNELGLEFPIYRFGGKNEE